MARIYWLTVLLNLCIPCLAQVDLQRGLVACYPFSSNANDGSGNDYHGTLHGPTPTADRFGSEGSAYLFDGKDDFISLPPSPFRNQNFTFAMWVKVAVFPPNNTGTVISIGSTTQSNSVLEVHNQTQFLLTPGLIDFYFMPSSDKALHTGLGLPLIEHWYHFAAEKDDTYVRFYVDGVKFQALINIDGSPQGTYYDASIVALIGMRSTNEYPFFGAIDDLVVYDRALSDAEVLKLYLEGIPCQTPLPSVPKADFTALCGEGEVVITATGGTRYRWYDAEKGGNMIFEGNPLVIPNLSSPTVYYVTNVTDTGESWRIPVMAIPHPLPEIICDFSQPGFTRNTEVYTVETKSGTPPFQYVFNFGDGSEISTTESTQEHTYQAEGVYPIHVMATDAAGCTADCSQSYNVIDEDLFIPNIITPNNDGHNDVFSLYLRHGINYAYYYGRKHFVMRIVNRWGDEIFSSNDPSAGWKGDDVSAGVYFYEIVVGDDNFKGWVVVAK